VVALATAVGANSIGVMRSTGTSMGDGSIEIAAKGEAVELRDGDQLLLLAEEALSTRYEYFVSLEPMAETVATGADGRTEPAGMPGASSEHGVSTTSASQAAQLATFSGACGAAGRVHSDWRMPDATSDSAPSDHAAAHQDRAGAADGGPPAADHGHRGAAHAHHSLAGSGDEHLSTSRPLAMLGDTDWAGSPAPKRMRVGQSQGSVVGTLPGTTLGASLEDPIEL
jgi:hypothetical protein